MTNNGANHLEIRVDRERLRTQVKVGELLGLAEGRFMDTRAVLSRFVIGEDGNYLPPEEGLKCVDQLSIEEMFDTGNRFLSKAEDTASPPESAPT